MLICYDSEGNQLLHIIDIFNHLDQEKINSECGYYIYIYSIVDFEGLLMKIGLIPNILKIDLTDFGLGDFIFVKDQEDIRVIIQKEMEERGQEERIEKSIGNKETKQQIVGLSMNINEELFECFESLLYEVDENGNPIQNSVPKIPNKNQLLTKNLQFYKEFYELEEL